MNHSLVRLESKVVRSVTGLELIRSEFGHNLTSWKYGVSFHWKTLVRLAGKYTLLVGGDLAGSLDFFDITANETKNSESGVETRPFGSFS